MKLLFDENLSPLLIRLLADVYPQSQHVDLAGLHGRPDLELWEYARSNGLTIVSKDGDFRELSFLHGSPPKVMWLSVGNSGTVVIEQLLRAELDLIRRFAARADDSLLELHLRQ